MDIPSRRTLLTLVESPPSQANQAVAANEARQILGFPVTMTRGTSGRYFDGTGFWRAVVGGTSPFSRR